MRKLFVAIIVAGVSSIAALAPQSGARAMTAGIAGAMSAPALASGRQATEVSYRTHCRRYYSHRRHHFVRTCKRYFRPRHYYYYEPDYSYNDDYYPGYYPRYYYPEPYYPGFGFFFGFGGFGHHHHHHRWWRHHHHKNW